MSRNIFAPYDAHARTDAETKWGILFDLCAITGQGPHQDQMNKAFPDFVESANPEYEMVEAALWCFIRDRYGWAIPTGETLDTIANQHKNEPIVEIGCGSGYVSACLKARGAAIRATNAPGTKWDKWWFHKFFDAETALASEISYDPTAYVMIMPDHDGAGEDMMAEALSRMPIGTTLYLYAPEECSGSEAGNAWLQLNFSNLGSLPMLNTMPTLGEEDNRRMIIWKKVRNIAPPDRLNQIPGIKRHPLKK